MDYSAKDQSANMDQDDPHRAYQDEASKPSKLYEEASGNNYNTYYDNQPDQLYKAFANFVGIHTICRDYNESFASRNKLYKYIRSGYLRKASIDIKMLEPMVRKASYSQVLDSNKVYQVNNNKASCNYTIFKVIKSDSTKIANMGTELAFRGWNYIYILIRLLIDAIDYEIYINTGCGVTLADKLWLLALLLYIEIR